MAKLLWGKVYFADTFAGYLREEPGDRVSFTYDESYLEAGHSAIAHTLPIQTTPHVSESGLHPFFDNLVAEGWLEQMQTRLLGMRSASRFELLLAFGQDCAGAVSVMDPQPAAISKTMLDSDDPKEMALLTSRASLSGIQPKLTLIKKNGKFYPSKLNELSTHIAKLPSQHHADLVWNEYLSTQALKALLPEDDVVDLFLGEAVGLDEPALIIKRFDRDKAQRIHFEEFTQLLNRKSTEKYDGSHKEMADFIRSTAGCLPAEIYRLYGRILAGILLGNTDMHLKNFSMLHTPAGLRLTPAYDTVAAIIYGYKTLALAVGGASNLSLPNLKAGNIIKLGKEFALPEAAMHMLVKQLGKNKEAAKQSILEADLGVHRAASKAINQLKDQLINQLEKRWNGTFALIGKR